MIKRFAFLVALMAVLMVFSAGMAMAIQNTATAIVSLNVPSTLAISDLDSFSLTLTGVPGTATGSDTFTVDSNGASGVIVTGSCSTFNPPLADITPTTTIINGTSTGPGAITPTATVSVDVVLADAEGARTATLTITAVDN